MEVIRAVGEYVILTDSSADLTAELVAELGVEVIPLSFTMEDKTYFNYPDNRDIDPADFYARLRGGAMATTAAVNVADYTEAIEPILKEGKDVLVLAFSSGLSATCHSAQIAAGELMEQYPDRKVYVVDTLCASLGQGLLVWYAANLKKQGKTMEEVRDWTEEHKLNLCHWFTVDDLHFLKRGGRISAATAVLGTMLSIKPVMHVDNEGHLIKVGTARGRNASLKALVDHMEQTVLDLKDQAIFISHGDCLADAQKVADDVKARFGVESIIINYVGPVIGAHSGPGTVALFFMGSER
nr:DegV family protein [Flavonifractor plautii]